MRWGKEFKVGGIIGRGGVRSLGWWSKVWYG